KHFLTHLFKARPSIWGDLQKAHPKLIILNPSNGCQVDRHRLRQVGKPELQAQTHPTRRWGRSLDPTSLPSQVHKRPVSQSPSMLIFHPPLHHATNIMSLGHPFTPSGEYRSTVTLSRRVEST